MAAKAGAAHFMHSIALELAAYDITVNAIAPGFIVTNIGGGHAHNPEIQAAMRRTSPCTAWAFPTTSRARAVPRLARLEYITGQEIIIDGGWGLGVAD